MYSNSWLIGFLLFVEFQQTILGRPANQIPQASKNLSVKIYESNASCECDPTNTSENKISADPDKNPSLKLETVERDFGHLKRRKNINASDPEVEHLSNEDNGARRESDTLKRETYEIYRSNQRTNHEYVEEGGQATEESEAPAKLFKSSLGSFVTNLPSLSDLQKNRPAVFGKSKTMSNDDD